MRMSLLIVAPLGGGQQLALCLAQLLGRRVDHVVLGKQVASTNSATIAMHVERLDLPTVLDAVAAPCAASDSPDTVR